MFSADALAHVTQQFREHLLENSLYSLVTPGSRQLEGGSQYTEVHVYTQLLTDISNQKSKDSILSLSAVAASGKYFSQSYLDLVWKFG